MMTLSIACSRAPRQSCGRAAPHWMSLLQWNRRKHANAASPMFAGVSAGHGAGQAVRGASERDIQFVGSGHECADPGEFAVGEGPYGLAAANAAHVSRFVEIEGALRLHLSRPARAAPSRFYG